MPLEANNFFSEIASQFGFDKFGTGMGIFENFFLFLLLSVFMVIIIGFIIYFWYMRRSYKHRVFIYGKIGNAVMKKFEDRGKVIAIGRAGDRLFYLRKLKRYLPPPTIQSGKNEWVYWEREDLELINIGFEDVDAKMREMKVKFVDTDMRMQRLGIEKNLQFRFQQQNFWEKYGGIIIQAGFYVLLTVMIIILFYEWRKTGEILETIANRVGSVTGCDANSNRPPGSGVVPAIALPVIMGGQYGNT